MDGEDFLEFIHEAREVKRIKSNDLWKPGESHEAEISQEFSGLVDDLCENFITWIQHQQ